MAVPLADEILRRLIEAGGKPLSGQKLAAGLGVTRAAVWKGVTLLRTQGYRVESESARGYRLDAATGGVRPGEVASRLRTRNLGRPMRHLLRVDSTNREAERWAQEGAPEGALVVAELQEAGRGRLGRSWCGLPGKSLLLSLLLRPEVPPAEAPLLTFVASIGLAEALSHWVPEGAVEIKWPNDVLLGGRKAAGILLEMRSEAQRVEHVVLGVGVNVEGTAEDFPADVQRIATTVAAEAKGGSPDRLSVLCAFLEAFEEAYELFAREGFSPLSARWNRWCRMAGRPVRVHTAGGVVEGVARGLGPLGALILEGSSGVRTEIYAGDVELSTTRAA